MAYVKKSPPHAAPPKHWRESTPTPQAPGPFDIPDCALPVWLDAEGNFIIALPDATNGRGHTVCVKYNEHSAKLLRDLMTARRAAPFARICERASPTQHDLDIIARALGAGAVISRDKINPDALADDDFEL